MTRGSLDVCWRSFGGVTGRFSVRYPSGGSLSTLDIPAGLYLTLEDLAAAMHSLLQGVNVNLSCTVSGDVITVASTGAAFDLYVTSLTLRAWLGLSVPAASILSANARAPMRFLSSVPWGGEEHTHVRLRRSATLAHNQVGAVTLSTGLEHRWLLTLTRAELARFRFVASALLRGLPGYCKPDFSNVGIWEWDNRGGGFPCVAAPGWRDYADRWANDTCHLVMQLPVVLREVP